MGKKISQLPSGTAISGPELFPAVQSGTTKKFTLSTLMSWLVGVITPTSIGAQPKITASGILKGDGAGGVGAAVAGTDYQAPLTAGTDYATPAQLEGKANQTQLAVVETGSTASVAHAVGEYFCWNGLLYRATAAISVGQSFTPGTNCYQTTAMDMVPPRIIGGDLNDYTTPGLYMWTDAVASMPNNTPIVAQSVMIVLQASQAGRVCQIVFAHNATRNGAYYRWLFSNAWTSWYTIG